MSGCWMSWTRYQTNFTAQKLRRTPVWKQIPNWLKLGQSFEPLSTNSLYYVDGRDSSQIWLQFPSGLPPNDETQTSNPSIKPAIQSKWPQISREPKHIMNLCTIQLIRRYQLYMKMYERLWTHDLSRDWLNTLILLDIGNIQGSKTRTPTSITLWNDTEIQFDILAVCSRRSSTQGKISRHYERLGSRSRIDTT
jgi:hypothetical protein